MRRLLRIVFAFVIVFLAGIVSVSVSAIFRSHSNLVSGITFLAAVACLVLIFEKMFPSVYSGLRQLPWWQTRGGEAVFVVALAFIISILSSRVATLWFGLLVVSGVLVALLLRLTTRYAESPDLFAKVTSGIQNRFQRVEHMTPQSSLKSSGTKLDSTLRPTQMWDKPPFSIPDNYAIDVRNLAGLREWYKEKLGLQEANTDREEDSGRPFADLHVFRDDTFLSLVELPSGATAERRHVIFYAKYLEKAHKWLAGRGVFVEPITRDSGGNRLFRFHDLEGNTIEVCVEPG